MSAPALPDPTPPQPGSPPIFTAVRQPRRPLRMVSLVSLIVLVFGAGIAIGHGTGSPVVSAQDAGIPVDAPADFDVYWEALQLVRDQFVDPSKLGDQNLTWGSIRGMVQALGDTGHTTFLSPDEVKAEQDALSGTISGIGVIIDQRGGIPAVVSVFDGGPADRAGVRVGDIILEVDGRATDRMTPDQVVQQVRGPKGSTVTLRVRHRGGKREEVVIVRDEIVIPTVSWAFVPGTRIADVRLVQFSGGAGDAVREAVRAALDGGATRLILDLRGNPGGLVDEAVNVASAFLPDGVVYQEQDRAGTTTAVDVRGDAIAADVPMVVLVDHGSASSAEIVTGALQDSGRARVVGERTFGTGTVLSQFDLSDGSALRLGVLEWLTPKGDRIFDTGIAPDVAVTLSDTGSIVEPDALASQTRRQFAANDDRQLQRAAKLLAATR